MEGQPAGSGQDQQIAGSQPKLPCGIGPPRAAEAKQGGVAKRNRQHRKGEICLVTVLVQTHARFGTIEVH